MIGKILPTTTFRFASAELIWNWTMTKSWMSCNFGYQTIKLYEFYDNFLTIF